MKIKTFVWTLLLSVAGFAGAQEQTYPNIKGTTLLEDERVIVQHFVLPPGASEGIHTHPEYQLVLVLKRSDELVSVFGDKEYVFQIEDPDELNAFWRPGPVSLEEKHDSINRGTRPLEWIAISFKKESIAAESTVNIFEGRDQAQ